MIKRTGLIIFTSLMLWISICTGAVCLGAEAPITPAHLEAKSATINTIKLMWDLPEPYQNNRVYTCIIEEAINNGEFKQIYKGPIHVEAFTVNKVSYNLPFYKDCLYTYRVTHYNLQYSKKGYYEESKSSPATVTYAPKPNAPSFLIANMSETQGSAFDLQWQNNSEAGGHFSIYKSWNDGANSESIDVSKGVYYTDKNVKPNTIYTYQVKALSKDGKLSSDPSNTISISSIPSPTDVKATKTSPGTCLLTWKYPPTPGAKLVVERKPIFGKSYIVLATLSSEITQYIDKISLIASYNYRIKVVDKSKKSSWYAGYVDWKPVIVNAIKLTARAVSPTQINISWKNTYGAKTEFIVHRKGPDGTKDFKLPANTTSYQDKTVKPGSKYIYTVDAVM